MSNDLGPYTQNLEQMLGERGAYDGETDAYAVLYGIALDLLTECSALRTTEHNLRAVNFDLVESLKHIEGVAMADEPRDLPGIAETASAAIAKAKGKE